MLLVLDPPLDLVVLERVVLLRGESVPDLLDGQGHFQRLRLVPKYLGKGRCAVGRLTGPYNLSLSLSRQIGRLQEGRMRGAHRGSSNRRPYMKVAQI